MRIPEAELDILAVLWREGSLTAAEIRKHIEERRKLSHASVLTLVGRLQERGLVSVEEEKRGKAFLFRPRKSRTIKSRLIRDFVDRVFDGARFDLVAELLDSKIPTDEELDRLQETIDEIRSKKHKKGR
ncbi:MAG TPA: hypothetical protein DDW52_18480 [Planctomycetaceae bacterium]|nr:hypothetical protein [Planctomycetaceae bacterium]